MKRSWIKKIGRQGKINIEANRILKEKYKEAGINSCEICGSKWELHPHHKHHRYYYKTAEELADLKESVLLCPLCHNKYMPDSKDTLELFLKLRGKENDKNLRNLP